MQALSHDRMFCWPLTLNTEGVNCIASLALQGLSKAFPKNCVPILTCPSLSLRLQWFSNLSMYWKHPEGGGSMGHLWSRTGLGWGLKIHIPEKVPGDADAAGVGSTPGEPRLFTHALYHTI